MACMCSQLTSCSAVRSRGSRATLSQAWRPGFLRYTTRRIFPASCARHSPLNLFSNQCVTSNTVRPVGFFLHHYPSCAENPVECDPYSSALKSDQNYLHDFSGKESFRLVLLASPFCCNSIFRHSSLSSLPRPLTQSFVTAGLWTTLSLGMAALPASNSLRALRPFSAMSSSSPGPCILLPLPPSPSSRQGP